MKYKIGTHFKVKSPNPDCGEEYMLCLVDYRNVRLFHQELINGGHAHIEEMPHVVLICTSAGNNLGNRWSRSPFWCKRKEDDKMKKKEAGKNMKKIYKYAIEVIDYQMIKLPKDANILTVQMQRGIPCIWVLLDIEVAETEKVDRHFFLAGTGHELPKDIDNMFYIGSFQMNNETLIFHLFEYLEPRIVLPEWK